MSATFFSLQLIYTIFNGMSLFFATSVIFFVVYFVVTVFPVPVFPYMNKFDGFSNLNDDANISATWFICSSLCCNSSGV